MDDLISRQAALEKVRAMQTYKLFMGDDMILIDKAEVQTELMMLPSAQPEPHEGTWVYGEDSTADCVDGYRCSRCGFFVPWDYNHKLIDYINDYAYCPKCGARMKGERQK